jgi:hypothetical protein
MTKNSGFCPNFSGLAYTHDMPNRIAVIRLRCGLWSCDFCAKKNAQEWSHFLQARLKWIGHWHFITLTAHPHAHEDKKTLENIRTGIDLIFKRLRRIGKISYVRVFETHKSGAIHAHILISGLTDRIAVKTAKNGKTAYSLWRVPQAKARLWALKSVMKKMAHECGIGYMVDVQSFSQSQHAVRYMVKYLTKDSQRGITEKYVRRIATSQDIGSPKSDSQYTWRLTDKITPFDVINAQDVGRKIVDLSNGGHVVTLADFTDKTSYP